MDCGRVCLPGCGKGCAIRDLINATSALALFFLSGEAIRKKKQMIHPDTELRFISPEKGYGVVATKLIPKGAITWAFDALDHKYTDAQVARMEPPYQAILDKYC